MSTLVQVPHRSVSGDYRESAAIRLVPEELSERHSIDWMHYEEDGLGKAAGAAFRASNGHYFGVVHLFHTRVLGQHGSGILTLHASPEEADTLDAALCDLGLTTADTTWIRDDIHLTPHDLIRQDDHGNRFCVGTYSCRADALAAQRQLAASIHKQDYWIHAHEQATQCA